MFCPKCGIANLIDAKFCRECGHGLAGHRGAPTDPLAQIAQAPASITEHTTLNLESPEPASGEERARSQVDSTSSAS